MHTPGSSDYQQPDVTYLDILRQAELRGLDIIAFTDHNTINGYKTMMQEIDQLTMLESLGRATPEELRRLADYRRLLDKILVLPGFEFTATFGFHILGLFSPETPIRQIEHILLSLNIPPSTLDEGSSIVGASSDVLTAYRTINEAGGIVVAAHVNTAHGVAMRGFDFGGQTKIAYTQDPYLHALEVTDLDRRGPLATARFFDGSKPEYPRRMRCVQGSDAHRLNRDDNNPKNLGIGDRPTEIQLSEASFDALKEVFQSADYARTRAYRGPLEEIYDYVQLAREKGSSETAAFYETAQNRAAIAQDVCAMANTSGGTIYIGCSDNPIQPPVGCDNLSRTMEQVRNEIQGKISPAVKVKMEPVESSGRVIIRIEVPKGEDQPYAIEDSRIYVRIGAQTILAGRDQIVKLVASAKAVNLSPLTPAVQNAQHAQSQQRQQRQQAAPAPREQREPREQRDQQPRSQEQQRTPRDQQRDQRDPQPRDASRQQRPERGGRGGQNQRGRNAPNPAPLQSEPAVPVNVSAPQPDFDDELALPPQQTVRPSREPVGAGGTPRSGVEIIGTETRKGLQYHVLRNLQNGQTVPNVTRQSASKLWLYAIMQKETNPTEPYSLTWKGNVALIKRYRRNNMVRYDLAMRDSNNPSALRVFYGVTDEGLAGAWLQFASDDYPIVDE
jgi:hypothetical protein